MRVTGLLALTALAVRPILSAYVQTKPCSDAGGHGDHVTRKGQLQLTSVRASIDEQQNGDSRLELILFTRHPDWKSCDDDWRGQYASTVQMTTLQHSPEYEGTMKAQECIQTNPDSASVRFTFIYDVDRPHPLDTYMLTVSVREEKEEKEDADEESSACVNAPLTPDVGGPIAGVALWIPIVTLSLVILAALLHESAPLDPGQDERHHSPITQIADCLSYVQFIFFSSALSLSYPGFLQPVASKSSWSTLMLRSGVVVRDPWYDGVRDGLYQINGTFGGTYGLELMTQVMGGTVTAHTWLNTIALAAILFVLLTATVTLGERLMWTRDWFKVSYSLEFRHGSDQAGMKGTMWKVLRLFCTYFIMPLFAWTTYQLGHAQWLSVFYTISAAAVITIILLLVWWAFYEASPRSMGYMLVRTMGKGLDNSQDRPYVENAYAASFFLLLVVRGSAIGGLQMVGMTQLLVMMIIEVVQIGLQVVMYGALSTLQPRVGLMPVIRLTILMLEISFLPSIAELGTRIVVGYILLGIHALVLVTLFCAPALLDLISFAHASISQRLFWDRMGSDDGQRPQIYGLRQLVRRPTNPESHQALSVRGSSSDSHSPPPVSPSPKPSHRDSTSPYFRQPRITLSLATLPPVDVSSRASSAEMTSSDGSIRETEQWTEQKEEEDPRAAAGVLPDPSPLSSHVDYSFREADLYYTRPRCPSFRQAEPGPKKTVKHKLSSMLRK